MTELKKCPFCGGEAIVTNPTTWQAWCVKCGAIGPWKVTKEEAIEVKKRAQAATMPGAREAFNLAAEALANADVPGKNVGDTISRQAAIAMCRKPRMRNADCSDFEMEIMMLPSAQPEIIQCKDCKYWIPYDWMFREVWQSRNIADYPEDEIGCTLCDMAMKANDYCSRAERREVTE